MATPTSFYVNGRSTLTYLGTLPTAIIERIEIDTGVASSKFRGAPIGSVVNIVLKKGGGGNEVQFGLGVPNREGGGTEHASTIWGADTSDGNFTIGAARIKREGVIARDRSYTRAKWEEGGSFEAASGVSVGGNTYFDLGFERTYVLGDCDTEIYTGPLTYKDKGEGCGFPWANHAWLAGTFENTTFYLHTTKDLTEKTNLSINARMNDAFEFHRHAPAVGLFFATLPRELAESEGVSQQGFAFHRFIAHGTRYDPTDFGSIELGMELNGEFENSLLWNASVDLLNWNFYATGDGYVKKSAVREAIFRGDYNIGRSALNQSRGA